MRAGPCQRVPKETSMYQGLPGHLAACRQWVSPEPLSHCPHLTYPCSAPPLASINQNKAFCVPLVRSPIGVWKFSCSFPSIFCHSSELVKRIKGNDSQPRKAAELATGCGLRGCEETPRHLCLPRQHWQSHCSFPDRART